MFKSDVAVVGSGIMGLATAYAHARRGKSVAVFERSSAPMGMSRLNYGIVAPPVFTPEPVHSLAIESAFHWRKVIAECGVEDGGLGLVVPVYEDDELDVAQELVHLNTDKNRGRLRIIQADQASELLPGIRRDGLQGGLHSQDHLSIPMGPFLESMIQFLEREFGVVFFFNTTVVGAEDGYVGNDRLLVRTDQTILCTGDDFQTLFPGQFSELGLSRKRLQLLSLEARDGQSVFGASLGDSVLMTRYPVFQKCPTIGELSARLSIDRANELEHGVNLLVNEQKPGHLCVGFAEKQDIGEPLYSEAQVDDMLLHALGRHVDLDRLKVTKRWCARLLTGTGLPVRVVDCSPGVKFVGVLRGLGLTLAFGVAERLASGKEVVSQDSNLY